MCYVVNGISSVIFILQNKIERKFFYDSTDAASTCTLAFAFALASVLASADTKRILFFISFLHHTFIAAFSIWHQKIASVFTILRYKNDFSMCVRLNMRMAMRKSFFRSTANVVSMIVVGVDFIVLISIVNTITRRFAYIFRFVFFSSSFILFRIGNRFMSFYFHFSPFHFCRMSWWNALPFHATATHCLL